MARSDSNGALACALLACLAMLVPTGMLSAQEGETTYAPPPPPPPPPPSAQPAATTAVAPPPPPHPSQAQTAPPPPPAIAAQAAAPQPEPPQTPRRRTQSNVWLEVPIFLNVDSDIVRPGFGLAFRTGLRVKDSIVPGVEIGASWNPIDLSNDPSLMTNIKDPLWRIYFNLGIQFQFETEKVTPYASVAMDFNFWHFLEESVACGIWACTGYARFRFTPGLTSRIGFTLKVNPRMGLDLGLRIGWTGEGDFFDERHTWLAPYVGMNF